MKRSHRIVLLFIALIRYQFEGVFIVYVDQKEETEKQGLGFVEKEDEKELKVNVSKDEVDKLIKEYKKIKKREKSNLHQVKLLDKHGKPLK